MKMFKLHTVAMASCLLLASGGAMATTITNSDGTFSPFGGFDWASNGTAVVDGFDATKLTGEQSTFDLTYYATAASVLKPDGTTLTNPTVGILLGNYEYTIQATLNETSTCNADNGSICTDASFDVNSGSFTIWYDTSPNADMVSGAGITDGISIIAGTIIPQAGGGFNIVTGGSATLQALITSTNNSYINPDLAASTATTSLQIGGNITGWTAPSSMPAAGGATQSLPTGYLALQADGNQNFSVPEPESVALLGMGLLGLAFARRRKHA